MFIDGILIRVGTRGETVTVLLSAPRWYFGSAEAELMAVIFPLCELKSSWRLKVWFSGFGV